MMKSMPLHGGASVHGPASQVEKPQIGAVLFQLFGTVSIFALECPRRELFVFHASSR